MSEKAAKASYRGVAEIFKTKRQLLVRAPTFKVRYHFRLIGKNGEIVSRGQPYTQKHNVHEVLDVYFPEFEKKDITKEEA